MCSSLLKLKVFGWLQPHDDDSTVILMFNRIILSQNFPDGFRQCGLLTNKHTIGNAKILNRMIFIGKRFTIGEFRDTMR